MDNKTDLWLLGYLILSLYDKSKILERFKYPLGEILIHNTDIIDRILEEINISEDSLKTIIQSCLKLKEERIKSISEVIKILKDDKILWQKMGHVYRNKGKKYLKKNIDELEEENIGLNYFVIKIAEIFDSIAQDITDKDRLSQYRKLLSHMSKRYRIPFFYVHSILLINIDAHNNIIKEEKYNELFYNLFRSMKQSLTSLEISLCCNNILQLFSIIDPEINNEIFLRHVDEIKEEIINLGTILRIKYFKKISDHLWQIKLEIILGENNYINNHMFIKAKDYYEENLKIIDIKSVKHLKDDLYQLEFNEKVEIEKGDLIIDEKYCGLEVKTEHCYIENEYRIYIYSEIQNIFNKSHKISVKYRIKDRNKYSSIIFEKEDKLDENNSFIISHVFSKEDNIFPYIDILKYNFITDFHFGMEYTFLISYR